MHRERPLERFLSRLLVVSLLTAQLPLVTIARADDSDALAGANFGNAVIPADHPEPPRRPKDLDALAAKAKREQQSGQSPIALCDGDDGSETATPGYGAPVQKWPQGSNSEFQQHLEAYVRERARVTIDNPSVNGVHKSFPGNQTDRPDLSPSIAARKRFFDVAFGVTNDGTIGSAAVSICETKVKLADRLKAYTDQKQKGEDNTNACSGAFKQTQKLFSEAQKSYHAYSDLIDHFLKGYTGKINGQGQSVKIPSLEAEFFENRRKNLDNINLYKPPVTTQRPIKVDEKSWASLKAEYNILWGKGSVDRGSNDKSVDLTGIYSSMLLQTRKEKAKADDQLNYFKKENEAIAERAKKCGFLPDKAASKPLAGKSSGPTITGAIPLPPKRPSDVELGISGASSPHTGGKQPRLVDPIIDPENPGRQDDKNWRTSQPPPDVPSVTTVTVTDTNADTRTSTPDPGTPPAAPQQPNGAVTFLKDNWMWLAGGAALVGGGVYLYNKNKQDTDRKNYWQDDSNFLPAATSASTTTASSGTAAAGSKFSFISSLSGPGGIGQSMGPISITVTDANNVIQNVNGTVTLSCAAPSPCSIGGGTTATLTSGQATFTGVTFSNADQNVLLQVSGAGIANSTAPSTFNVGGSTATNPRY